MESDTIDLLKLWRLFRKNIWLLILLTVLGVIVSGVVTVYFMPRLYSADVLMYIWQDNNSESGELTAGDLNLFSQLVADYQVLVKSRLVTEQVAEQLQLPSASAVANQITVSTKANTRHITISIKDQNPEMAALKANTVAEVFSSTVVDKMGVGKVQIIDNAMAPASPVSPSLPRNIVSGAMIGFILAFGIMLLRTALDNTIRSAEDVSELTGSTLLGTIPEFSDGVKTDQRRRR